MFSGSIITTASVNTYRQDCSWLTFSRVVMDFGSGGMTLRKEQVLDNQMLRFLREPGSFMTPLSVRPHVQGEGYTPGHYIYLLNPWPLLANPIGGKHYHFVGIHDCMCITLRRPENIITMLRIARDLPSLEPFGAITWLGGVKIYSGSPKRCGRIYIPNILWNPCDTPLSGVVHTHAVIHPVKSARSNFIYYLMEIPAFQRDRILSRYFTSTVPCRKRYKKEPL